jgi:hypothetical protein
MSEPIKKTATVHLTADDAGFECAAKVTREFRELKATLPADEFWAVQWAARHTPWKMADGRTGKSSPLDQWLRSAVLEQVRATVKAEIARGKSVPPDIAAIIDHSRGE